MSSQHAQTLSKVVLGLFLIYFIYLFSQAIDIVNHRHIGTDDGIYINHTQDTIYLKKLAEQLTQTCENKRCQIQNILDYVSNIPYQINHFNAHSPQKTIQNNFGDCDDKSNLLISLLHEKKIESYFVLVPNHIFVIVALKQNLPIKGLYLNGKKYYVLESTAKNSSIGFPLYYSLDKINTIIEPFENKRIDIQQLEWKL